MANVRSSLVKNFGQLQGSITPQVPGQPERIPWTWYDTVTYVDNTSTLLEFFQIVRADKVLGNMQAAGQIPAPMYFEIHHLMVQPIFPQGGTAIVSVADQELLSRARIELEIAQKIYFETRVIWCPSGGGLAGAVGEGGAANIGLATNGIPDLRNRNNFWGDLMLPHNQNFTVRLRWSAPVDIAANRDILIGLDGYLYRRVL